MKDFSTYNNTSEKGFPPYTLWKNLANMASAYESKILYVEIKVELRSFASHGTYTLGRTGVPIVNPRLPCAAPMLLHTGNTAT